MSKLILSAAIAIAALFASGCAVTVRTPPRVHYVSHPPQTVIVEETVYVVRPVTSCTWVWSGRQHRYLRVCRTENHRMPRSVTKRYTAYWYENLGGYYYYDDDGRFHRMR